MGGREVVGVVWAIVELGMVERSGMVVEEVA